MERVRAHLLAVCIAQDVILATHCGECGAEINRRFVESQAEM
jgi:hypothetical protein